MRAAKRKAARAQPVGSIPAAGLVAVPGCSPAGKQLTPGWQQDSNLAFPRGSEDSNFKATNASLMIMNKLH